MPCPNLRIEFCIVNQKLFSLAVMFNLIHINIAPIQNTTKILSWHRYVCGFAGQRPQNRGGFGLIWLPLIFLFFLLFTLLGIFRGYKRFFRRAMLESSDFVKDDYSENMLYSWGCGFCYSISQIALYSHP